MDITLPTETGEQLAFGAAAFVALVGLMMLLAPRFSLRLLGFETPEFSTAPFSEMRSSLGGIYLGLGLSAILVAQPFIYFSLGCAFALAAFARVLSILSDRGTTLRNYLLLVVQVALAVLPLSYFFGYI